MNNLICDHCNSVIQNGKSFYKHLGEVFCCKKCFNDHLWGGRDESCYCDEVRPVYMDVYNDEYKYYCKLQSRYRGV